MRRYITYACPVCAASLTVERDVIDYNKWDDSLVSHLRACAAEAMGEPLAHSSIEHVEHYGEFMRDAAERIDALASCRADATALLNEAMEWAVIAHSDLGYRISLFIQKHDRAALTPAAQASAKPGALPVADLWRHEDGRTAITDYVEWDGGGRWHLVGPLYLAAPPAAPEGWSIEVDDVQVAIRHKMTQCEQAFYPDRDPLIHQFLRALASAPGESGT